MKFERANLPQSEVELKVMLDPKEWDEFINEAVKELSRETKVEGFRPGHVPRHILEQRIGSGKILEKAADMAVRKTYVKIITENKIEAISRPEIQVTKLAPENEFEFKAKFSVMPEIILPDYKSIAQDINKKPQKEIEVQEKEVQDSLSWLQKSRTKFVTVNREAKKGDRVEVDFTAKKDGQAIEGGVSKNHPIILGEEKFVPGFEDNLTGLKENEEKKFNIIFPADFAARDLAGRPIDFEVKMNLVQEAQVPELNDEFAKGLGAFENIEALKKSIREGLGKEKEMKQKDEKRLNVLTEINKHIKTEIPKILLDAELEKMTHELKDSITQMGLDFEAYLKNIKKTEEELKTEWAGKAKERIYSSLVLREIAAKENVSVTEKEIEEEVNKFLMHYPDAESAKQQIDINRLKDYTRERIKNEKVFELLENF